MFGKLKIYIIFVIFLLLPLFCTTSNVRKRRRPIVDSLDGIEGSEGVDQQTAIPDQIAIAAESNYQNAIQYEPEYIPKHNYRHGKLMIKYMNSEEQNDQKYHPEKNVHHEQNDEKYHPEPQQYPAPDIINVADTETAEEYVQKALELNSQNIESINPDLNIIPTSPRYDVFPKSSEQVEEKIGNSNYDQVTRSYDVYDYNEDNFGKQNYPSNLYGSNLNQYSVDRTKFPSNMKYYRDSSTSMKAAALTGTSPPMQIPKEEIRKHIEQAVVKYMKEMEAEGKIIKTSQTPKPKVYYKYPDQAIETSKPYISTTTSRTHNSYTTSSPIKVAHPTKHSLSVGQSTYKDQLYQPGNPLQDTIENLNQNVEFVYKMKPRQPSKQIKLSSTPEKSLSTNFDHSSAIKNFQGFDMSHVIQQDDRQSNKQKLYFNTEIHRDINSLPYKPEKNLKEPSNLSDYQGYGLEQGISPSSSNQYISLGDQLTNSEPTSSSDSIIEQSSMDDGYPIMNPYKYVLNKEPKYSETSLGNNDAWQPHIPDKENNNKINSHISQLKALEHDSYSPKFNNNPEGYGYQHNYNYKTIEPHHYHSTTKHPNRYFKRGKRGGNGNTSITYKKTTNRGIVNKDIEANIALRPPPKI